MKTLSWIVLALIALTSAAAPFVLSGGTTHGEHWWSGIPGFYLVFGFAGCAGLPAVAGVLAKLFLLQREDYYDGE